MTHTGVVIGGVMTSTSLADATVAKPSTNGRSGRSRRGQRANRLGKMAECAARMALVLDGWGILAQRVRTPAGEVDLIAEKEGLLAIVEVKCRPSLLDAAASLTARQQARLVAATDVLLLKHPDWGQNGVRFDLIVVDATGKVRRIIDAFRGTD
jgi:putative endonuclease